MTNTGSPPRCPTCHAEMVRRVRRSDGGAFLGCSRFPECRGTRALPQAHAAGPPPPPIVVPPRLVAPGASATDEFERRRQRHKEYVRRERPWTLLKGMLIFGVGIGLLYAPLSWRWIAIGTMLFAVGWTLAELFGTPDWIDAWRRGAEGEQHTAEALQPLVAEGFVVLHDRAKPRSQANIDHVVIGPTGVFVVETKRYRGDLVVRGDELFIDGRRKTGFIDQVKGQAGAVSGVLGGVPVTPLLCVHRATFPLVGRTELRGVRIESGGSIGGAISRRPVVMTPAEVARLVQLAEQRLPPARSAAARRDQAHV